jgi:hypothetical protein
MKKPDELRILENPWCRRLVPRQITRALPMLSSLCHQNRSQAQPRYRQMIALVKPQPTKAPHFSRRTSPRVPTAQRRTPPPAPKDRYPLRSRLALHCVANHVATINRITNLIPVHEANSVTDPITGQVQEYRHLSKGSKKATWMCLFANELGRLAQGIGVRMPTNTNTVFFLGKEKVPHGRNATYGRIVASNRPQKTEMHCTRLTVGGNQLDYLSNVNTPTAKLTTAKCLLNSTISTNNTCFIVCDIKDFYLNTPMECYKYMRLPIGFIPNEVIHQYKLRNLVTPDEWVYMEIRKGIYGLKQTGIIANQQLTKHLTLYGYVPAARTPGLCCHIHRDITLSLVADDFGIKYVGKKMPNIS